jgi:hypothetical protein
MRIHVKIGIPRKLYWADRLGMLIMADVPNSWGEPTDEMKKETKYALINMIERDYNHPSVFSWVIFNETWGLSHETEEGEHVYKPSTQEWVADMYDLAKSLDPTRLVEDNSPNKFDHVKTDLNTWHAYLAGYEWEDILDEYTEKTYPGSEWNYIGGRKQDDDPMFNSECGNVWGYKGSTGDVDWSWDYHIMMNEFRQHPLVCGWLYTEHHDVINEWNGYYRFDRSEKITGLDELVSGMTLNDLHAPYYISPDIDLCKEVKPGEQVDVPLYASFLADDYAADKNFNLQITLKGWNELGMHRTWHQSGRNIQNKPWMTRSLSPVRLTMPTESGLAILEMVLSDELGNVLHKNFTTFLITDATHKPDRTINSENNKIRAISVEPKSFARAYWSLKQWSVLDGLKVNGAGHGYFEYRIPWPKDLAVTDIDDALFMLEVSAKKLLGKDIDTDGKIEGSFMRGKGTFDPGLNRNAYPMTDTNPFPGKVRVEINTKVLNTIELKDDPADHRGILSWFSQKRDGYLREAGSYGYLVKIHIPSSVLQKANSSGELVIRLSVDEAMAHGLAIYGKRFGRYPIDPTVLLQFK